MAALSGPLPSVRLPAVAPPTVLVVGDEPAVADLLRLLLGDASYEVRCAYDGEAALAEAARCPPDAVVTDVMLPGLGGREVAGRLRERGIPGGRPRPAERVGAVVAVLGALAMKAE